MDEFGAEKLPADPEAYQELLKRWGLDDDTLGITKLRADLEHSETEVPGDTDASGEAEAEEVAEPDAESESSEEPVSEAEQVDVDSDVGLDFLDDADQGVVAAEVSRADRKQRRRWLRRSLLALGVVLALLLGTAGFYLVVGLQALQGIKRDPGLMPTDDGYQTVPATIDGPLNFLLMGSDSRNPDERGRSDTLMIAHLNASRDTLYLISLPRDMYVDIPGHGKNKINAAYAFGGPRLTVKTVQNIIGTRIDHTAMIDFEGFVGLTTDVGGVTVFNEIESTNLGFNFPRGDITISGEEALAYVRQRYDLPHGDFDRAARQRLVVKALILKLLKPATVANPATFNAVATKLGGYLTVDNKLTNELIWNLATDLNIKSARDIRQIQAPIARGATIKGSSVLIVNEERMAALAKAIRDDNLEAYWTQYGAD
ncbi:LCP family protein [Propionicimonas sp.]|uniref:LCP family protein n=1 Tax=Propionicimonas sp. TaxID=1955623 RepID=UPI0018482ADC|nr:LCP family protein [Propionicimonas sp.]MBU3975836.1 LCP family protein [Actinomycetota bacterium]MBA3022176.1 LytR family transcriptional regulator [Propionicimonas sp.]MBU3987386.1 LCP family protein [Actinomycetota bacterium]MBU4006395.1 LCP family protein [Actinomycetota bacterium]MBU4065274.1 LCP family protein [Actinomycetota bacterium]